MREFNTSGPCNPALHYTVMREALIAEGQEKVRKGRYFTLFAPRQTGKTTYFQLLLEAVKEEYFTPIFLSFESLKAVTREIFYQNLNKQLHKRLAKHQIQSEQIIKNQLDMIEFFEKCQAQSIVLVIDEFEGIPNAVLNEMMHAFRQMYHQKQDHALHSLILVGVSTIAELVTSGASPFNVAEELQVSYFTQSEVNQLIDQYVSESGQKFDPQVINAIYDNTKGQPGIVCALAAHLLKKVTNRTVIMADFFVTLDYFLKAKYDNNILNIIRKAKEKKAFMYRLLFGEQSIDFSVDVEDIAYLHANGVIDNIDGYVGIPVPLYSKRIITAFRPVSNGETRHYGFKVNESFEAYLKDGGLNLHAILNKYRQYVRKRGFKAFDTETLKEGAWHYSLDGFIHFFIEALEGQTFIEVPSGAGRTDILIVYQNYRYLIETKVFSNNTLLKKGKGQLAEYLTSEGLDEGYYVVFSSLHTDEDTLYFEDKIKGKQIYTYIICTHFPTPSRLPVPEVLKLTETELITRRRAVLEILVLRFDPPSSTYRKIEQDLLNLTDIAQLKKLLVAAVQSENVTIFQTVMNQFLLK
ncbi:AAA-like domain-containing protein [Candidatus Marithioploca araucensis]|uniref:AAA-like domain-containing protein n=1 Tax=Candidatus Marithioploca araucensis TaxID=70273 RepID=A0ABT7VRM1_9GAMM|nr:AAA-like domain-containing protein [Candidatus Marithioploca araucensis]